jgi:signal transduction histidine kinase
MQSENTRFALAGKAESEFLSTISREFRDHLGSIIGFCELLKRKSRGHLGKKQEQYVDNILNSGKSLITIIDDFELRRQDAGKIQLVIEKISVPEIINETFILIKEKALKQNVELKKDIDPSFDFLHADKKLLKLILFNLMGNATMSSPGGTVTITAKKEMDLARFQIAGSGWGDIAKKVIDDTLDPNTDTLSEIMISKKLVNMHGGEISADKEARITFILPIAAKKEKHK